MASAMRAMNPTDTDQKIGKGILLNPLDVMLFRDGRSFGAANRVVSGPLFPQTIAGAIRTALLRATGFSFDKLRGQRGGIVQRLRDAGADEDVLNARFRGPWFANCIGDGYRRIEEHTVLFPAPANVKQSKTRGEWLVAKPVEPNLCSGWQSKDGLWPMQMVGNLDAKADPTFFTFNGLMKFLDSAGASTFSLTDGEHGETFSFEQEIDYRVGIGIDSSRLSTIDGELYGIGFLSLPSSIRIYVEVESTQSILDLLCDAPISLGGEGKYAHAVTTDPCSFPAYDPNCSQSCWYVATPTFLSHGNIKNRPLPPMSFGRILGAASGPGLAVSGWDNIRGGPRKTQFAIPAGAVYYVDGPGSDGGIIEESTDRDARLQEGWGFAIQGKWRENSK